MIFIFMNVVFDVVMICSEKGLIIYEKKVIKVCKNVIGELVEIF